LRPLSILLALFLLAGCGQGPASQPADSTAVAAWLTPVDRSTPETADSVPAVELAMTDKDVKLAPLPLRAGVPFTITVTIHNDGLIPATAVPILVYLSDVQEQLDYTPFLDVVTATVPATRSASVQVPVVWNLAGGEHQLWVRVNDLPQAWKARTPVLPEGRLADNAVLLDLMIEPYDAYSSDLCGGRVDVSVETAGIWLEPNLQRVRVRVHNLGNQAAYNLPVIVTAGQATGVSYTPALPPCGGTAEVTVVLDQPLQPGAPYRVQVNPEDWPSGLVEDDFENNLVSVGAEVASGTPALPAGASVDYDFSLSAADVDLGQPGILLLTVHNLGTRAAARVPITIEGRAGRKIVDAVPLVDGDGLGVIAIQLGSLNSPGATLTISLNPADAKGAYPETNRDDNSLIVTIPAK